MPELPDVSVYVEAIARRVIGERLRTVRVKSAFLVRSVVPDIRDAEGRMIRNVARLGKRIALECEDELFLVIHLMIAGRFRWVNGSGTGGAGRIELARFAFDSGTLVLTEASTRKRASLHVVQGRAGLAAHTPAGLDVLACKFAEFQTRLGSERRTLKRALTDPRLFDGIGNAYSDEILHAASLSPMQLSTHLDESEARRLYHAIRVTLETWIARLRKQFGLIDGSRGRFPGAGEITAFRPDFAVHGRFGLACRVCGTAVQRIAFAENECHYCPRCQTQGRMLADRSLSRLLKDDWPRTIEELEGGI
jgi:formamidopyrimidine-DNA glycosylase